jgi:hypothetical protein
LTLPNQRGGIAAELNFLSLKFLSVSTRSRNMTNVTMRTRLTSSGATFLLMALVTYAGVASALPEYLDAFQARYSSSTTGAKAQCQVCHRDADPNTQSTTNVYGTQYAQHGDFATIEGLNADGVGGSNLQEILAGAQPGWCVKTKTTPNCLQQTGTPPAVLLDPLLSPDFNADVRSDILWRDSTGQNAIWLMNGLSLTSSALILAVSAPGWTIAGQGDFNGDGKADILWRNTTTGENAIWLMNGFTLTSGALILSVPTTWVIAGVGDFNGDGKADLLWRNTTTGDNGIWLMNGLTVSTMSLILAVPTGAWTIVGTGDFNGDGKSDILWRNDITGDNAIWLMNGTSFSSSALIFSVPTTWSIKGVGDYNGDGKADILWRNTTTGENAIWLMNGFTLSSAAQIPSAQTSWNIVNTP